MMVLTREVSFQRVDRGFVPPKTVKTIFSIGVFACLALPC